MARTKWELHEVEHAKCDECLDMKVVNIYRRSHGCICMACENAYGHWWIHWNVCGDCLEGWLQIADI